MFVQEYANGPDRICPNQRLVRQGKEPAHSAPSCASGTMLHAEDFRDGLAARIRSKSFLRSKNNGRHLSAHDATSLMLSHEILAYATSQVGKGAKSVYERLCDVDGSKAKELYEILVDQFPEFTLLQGKANYRKTLAAIWQGIYLFDISPSILQAAST